MGNYEWIQLGYFVYGAIVIFILCLMNLRLRIIIELLKGG